MDNGDVRVTSTRSSRRPLLGDVLVSSGVTDADTVTEALAEQAITGQRLGRLLVDHHEVGEQELAAAVASAYGMESVDLSDVVPDAAALARLPEDFARRHLALPLWFEGPVLVVGLEDPSNLVALDDVRALAACEVRFVVAPRPQLERAIEMAWLSELAVPGSRDANRRGANGPADLAAAAASDPVTRLVDNLLIRALREGASDIHIEPNAAGGRVRFRIDGMLVTVTAMSPSVVLSVTSRLKLLSGLDIAQHRLPQDGRMSLRLESTDVDVRVATLPTLRGEAVVLRLLDKTHGLLDINDLGFLPDTLETFAAAYRKPWGSVLVTGPTGCGKTTTLYAALSQVNVPDRNIVTVEDPVEYEIDGVKQIQVAASSGLTFARVLRSILRCDPDIVLVGEIRDLETAHIAAEAAMTGHLVLSTLHTNDASSAPTRLVEMGMPPFLVASSIDCVLAQRLARALCSRCREPVVPTPEELAAARWETALAVPDRLWRARGCPDCRGTGYDGRFAVHEVMRVTDAIRSLILANAPASALRAQAMADGMRSLRTDGLRKVAEGRTSLEELARVVST